MGINFITDTLLLAKVKQHLEVDADLIDDDILIQGYIDSSLAYVTNYTDKTFEIYNNTENFAVWDESTYLEWATEVRMASLEYTDTLGATKTISVQVYSDNIIRMIVPADYDGGVIAVTYTPYIEVMQVPISQQARLLLVGDWYISREDSILGTQVNELSNSGVNALLNSIKLGIM